MPQVHWIARLSNLAHPHAQFVDCCLYDIAIVPNGLLGEIFVVCVSAAAMDVMIDGGYDRVWRSKHGNLVGVSSAYHLSVL